MVRQALRVGYRKLLVNGLGGFWQSVDPLKFGFLLSGWSLQLSVGTRPASRGVALGRRLATA